MQQENVEVVKQIIPPLGTDYTVLFRDDAVWAAVKSAVEPVVDPDLEVAFVAWGQQLMEFTGIDGMREAWLQWLAAWASYYEDVEDVFAVGDDRVVVLGREHGCRLDTRAEVEAESAGVYLVRKGRIVRAEYYAKQAEALEAVGLSERDVQVSRRDRRAPRRR